jgi:hypothetical protein
LAVSVARLDTAFAASLSHESGQPTCVTFVANAPTDPARCIRRSAACHAGPAKSHIAPFALYAPSDASGIVIVLLVLLVDHRQQLELSWSFIGHPPR